MFLPSTPPLLQLPATYTAWDDLVPQLPNLIQSRQIRQVLEKLPILSISHLQTAAEQERALLLLSYFGHAFVYGGEIDSDYIPASIAIPWTQLASQMQRPAILHHASAVLNNWKIIDPKRAFQAENLQTLIQFNDSPNEHWFFMLTTEMEYIGAKTGGIASKLQKGILSQSKQAVAEALHELQNCIAALSHTLARMEEGCNPSFFYERIRPFLASFHDIRYEGVTSNSVRTYHGGSAAQSTLLPLLDSLLDIQHQENHSAYFLREMRKYMPPPHVAYLKMIENGPSTYAFCKKDTVLLKKFEECRAALVAFRNVHLKIVAIYIMAQAKKKVGPGATGTGGTNPMVFLKQLRDDGK